MGAKFSAPVQTGPGAYPTSHTKGAKSFWGVNWPGNGFAHPSPLSTEVKERIELYSYFMPGPERKRERDIQRESNNEEHEKPNSV